MRNLINRSLVKWPLFLVIYLVSLLGSSYIANLAIPLTGNTTPSISWPDVIMVAVAELIALNFIASASFANRATRFAQLFGIYWGTKSLMMLIEAAFFLNLWQESPLMPMQHIYHAGIQNALHALLVCGAIILVCNGSTPTLKPQPLPFKFKPLLYTAFSYVPLYMLAGVFLAMPLGGEAFERAYSGMTVPTWLPLFQLARGVIWAVIIWWLLRYLTEDKKQTACVVALSVFASVQLLLPNPYMLEQ